MTRHTPHQVVVQTYARAMPGAPKAIRDYVVLTAPDYHLTAKPQVFVTTDPARFEAAMDFEAHRTAVDVAWHDVRRADGVVYRELDFLEECHDEPDR